MDPQASESGQPADPGNSPMPETGSEPSQEQAELERKRSTLEKIKNLPTPIGVLLMGLGVVGLLVPGPVGTPLLLAGGLVLAPKAFGKLQAFLERRCPQLHLTGMEAVERFVADLEKRYPDQKA